MNYDHFDASKAEEEQDSLEEFLSCSEEALSLDKYQETGVYVEEDKDAGDLLIVLGESILKGVIRQFYISDDNCAYTRSCLEGEWDAWFTIPPKTIESKQYDFNTLLEPDFLLTTDVENFINSPEDFPKGSESLNNIIICMTALDMEHLVQFLIGDNHRTFWIRHLEDKSLSWSPWSSFI
ncbi:hypothetical protein BOKEGFJH_00681 [Chlamydia avium]|uniref:Uncharacterized protein n=1 Tax=Chlamydia avium TaxID=1457141 RepID=A0ABN0MTG8_9CHLA|nr:hypothetical protein [Chlamydia avium]EPP36138.1 hypothetical protein CP10743SC13_0046 [Chlamydia psittaci 10_743_SC13]EPP38875.1 hypothetical protein CP10881SC42_0133 [Chlamydia avium]VVT43146.1 hypothetical protein BOKEGFJH_00681 [Chlamydia avium]